MPCITSVSTAVPSHTISQQQAREFAEQLFRDTFRDIHRLLPIFDHAGVQTRHFCVPLSWFLESHSFAEKNTNYIQQGIQLGTQVIQDCLQKANLHPSDIDTLVFVSSSGISAPSLDAFLANQIGMKRELHRIPIWGLGCAGGVSGLARAAELAKANPKSRVLLVSLELCGITFIQQERTKSNLVACSLFGDGAAAVLVEGDDVCTYSGDPAKRLKIIGSKSTLWPNSEDVMGWTITDGGLSVVFSKDIPSIVTKNLRPEYERLLQKFGIQDEQVRQFIAHPGGPKVIEAYSKTLNRKIDHFENSNHVLRHNGNMSSPTVLFVLEKTLNQTHLSEGEYGVLLALGPGFSCEQVLVEGVAV
jgi:alkylresorcinol/alkylpyrone synthase